jgi:hypothetical protein
MKDFLNDLEIPLETKQERKNADLAIRKVIGKTKNDKCNMVWLEVKVWLQDENMKQKLADDLKLEEISFLKINKHISNN